MADYLYKRGDTYWLRLIQPPELGGKETRCSLRTKDKAEAEARAAPHIAKQKLDVLEARNRRGVMQGGVNTRSVKVAGFECLHPIGDHINDQGERVIATVDTVLFLKDGRLLREEKNDLRIVPTFRFAPDAVDTTRRKPVAKEDGMIMRQYLNDRQINRGDAEDAIKVWGDFLVHAGKRLKDCDRADVRAFIQHIEGSRKIAQKTLEKKIAYCSAAVNHAIIHYDWKGQNPFSNPVIKGSKEAIDRVPLTEADMELMKIVITDQGYDGTEEALLWVMLASTGMRVSECFVDSESKMDGIRYLTTGSKTKQSLRRVPLPMALEGLPPINKALFKGTPHNLGRNLNRIIRRAGITDPAKVVHSLRHRAKDRLREAGCPLDVQYELLGHEENTIASGYGHGHTLKTLKRWIDEIGIGQSCKADAQAIG